MAKQNTKQVVSNYHPRAVVVFLSLDAEGKPIKDISTAHTIVPDIDDIQSIQVALGSTGKTGQFTLKINNTNNKYYVQDNIEEEITNLQSGSSLTWISAPQKKKSVDIPQFASQTVDVDTVWENAKDFLNNVVYDRVYTPPGADDNFIYILYQDGTTSDGTPILRYRKIPRDEIEAYNHAKEIKFADVKEVDAEDSGLPSTKARMASMLKDLEETQVQQEQAHLQQSYKDSQAQLLQKLQNDLYGTIQIPKDQVKSIFDKARTQSTFFEEFGGQIEHGRCVFAPMQLCVILTSRRFRDANDSDDMVVTFTGYVDSVSDEFDGKTQIINIQGSDVTKLMRVTLANINPSVFEPGLPAGGEMRIWGNKFSGMQGWQIIKVLTLGGYDTEGQRVYGTGYFEYKPEANPQNSAAEEAKRISEIALINGLQLRKTDISGTTRSKLDTIFFAPKQVHLQVLPFDTKPKGFADYAVYKKIFNSSFQNWQNEYQNHLELANEVTKLTNYEFYADQSGDIWYHQPRFNNYHLLTAKNPEVYVLRDEDILNFNFSESDKDVVTSIYVMGQPNYVNLSPQIVKMTGVYEDSGLLRKYGRRYMTTHHPYITESLNCFYFAKSLLVRLNAGRFVGRVTILGRPEIRMHMPVYVPLHNMVYYIEGIQHSFTFGSTFTTTLILKYGHKPWEILPEILDYRVNTPSLTADSNPDNRKSVDEVTAKSEEPTESVSDLHTDRFQTDPTIPDATYVAIQRRQSYDRGEK